MLEAVGAFLTALLYAGMLSCAGAVFAEATLELPAGLQTLSTRTVGRAAILTIVTSLARAIVLVYRLGGQWDEVTLSAVFMSGSGAATCLQLVGAALLLASLSDASARLSRLPNAALLPLSLAFTGHAGAEGLPQGLVVSVHASAAAWWIGSLWLLRAACRAPGPAAVRTVQRFGVLATRVVGALLCAGLLLVGLLATFSRLPALAPYEAVLGVKVSLVAAALAIALYNRLRLTRRVVAGEAGAFRALGGTVTVELLLMAAILATTAVLTTYTSPE